MTDDIIKVTLHGGPWNQHVIDISSSERFANIAVPIGDNKDGEHTPREGSALYEVALDMSNGQMLGFWLSNDWEDVTTEDNNRETDDHEQ